MSAVLYFPLVMMPVPAKYMKIHQKEKEINHGRFRQGKHMGATTFKNISKKFSEVCKTGLKIGKKRVVESMKCL